MSAFIRCNSLVYLHTFGKINGNKESLFIRFTVAPKTSSKATIMKVNKYTRSQDDLVFIKYAESTVKRNYYLFWNTICTRLLFIIFLAAYNSISQSLECSNANFHFRTNYRRDTAENLEIMW